MVLDQVPCLKMTRRRVVRARLDGCGVKNGADTYDRGTADGRAMEQEEY